MDYKTILPFFLEILENMRIHCAVLKEPFDNAADFDYGIRKLCYPNIDYVKYTRRFCTSCKPNIIYKTCDEFSFCYLILLLPEEKEIHCLVIGPYTPFEIDEAVILNKAQEFHIPVENYAKFKSCYDFLPIIPDSSALFTIVNTFASNIWGSLTSFIMEELHGFTPENKEEDLNQPFMTSTEELSLYMRKIEEQYRSENELLEMVSHGHIHKVEMYMNLIEFHDNEQRASDKIRNAKNYAIIMNTLLRKCVENNAVHPVHIDRLSSSFAQKIEKQTSEKAIIALLKEMTRKYTLLVKNHSLKGYSPLVQRVLMSIDSDLTADLSLSALASITKSNPSYLSTVFKKETGQTLTDYVTNKRIEHAIFLLNATNMQIQTIASYCGIPDLCYFSKTFKKIVGKTPTEYRSSIM